MIELKNISKTFHTTSGKVEAVKDANILINDGEIFGFIGYSGAGKSTIVRCINLLERPTTGNIIFDDIDLTELSDSDLRKKRKEIGMIFQQFNLLKSLTVFENVAFNLKNESLSKAEIKKRVEELLDLVGIPEKADSYPSQLSGGQKQRVAIARALANNPKVLLCDEATSALDPQTTSQILQLIKELNQKLKITVIIITHEMAVIKSICDRVAVMENGNIVEVNNVYNLFSNPHTDISKGFVNSNSNKKNIINLIKKDRALFGIKEYNEVLDLDFLGANTKESIISSISKKYNIDCNIIFGDIDLIKNQMIGKLIVSLDGEKDSIENAKKYLLENGIKWEVIS
ncbi:methionine ABC transporter ATP-binding protein [Helcococcus sueciensis]|uniref:methionine ABC transporter ATP-binding protein n=1 Tax=Helcococcus sueciensis TaxID=241555 RepID=UPI0003FCC94F|nr:ATP-binding cassette domain-containing protein [Helcococcus sueciensis]